MGLTITVLYVDIALVSGRFMERTGLLKKIPAVFAEHSLVKTMFLVRMKMGFGTITSWSFKGFAEVGWKRRVIARVPAINFVII